MLATIINNTRVQTGNVMLFMVKSKYKMATGLLVTGIFASTIHTPAMATPWLTEVELGAAVGTSYASIDMESTNTTGEGLNIPPEPQIASRYRLHFKDLDSTVLSLQLTGQLANGKPLKLYGRYGEYGTGKFDDYDWYGTSKNTLHSLYKAATTGDHFTIGLDYTYKQIDLSANSTLDLSVGAEWERMQITIKHPFYLTGGRALKDDVPPLLVSTPEYPDLYYDVDIYTVHTGLRYKRLLGNQWHLAGTINGQLGVLNDEKDWRQWVAEEQDIIGKVRLALGVHYAWNNKLSSGIEGYASHLVSLSSEHYESFNYNYQSYGANLWLLRYRF